MNLKPVGDRVIIKQDEAGETTSSGLYIATESKEKPQSGTVLAVGEGKLDKDGNMVCESGPDKEYGYLATREYYNDFDLTLEFKQLANGNSGVFFRSFVEPPVKVHGWQCEVAPKGFDTAGIYESYGRGWLVQIPDQKENILREGEWNTLRLKVQGDRVQTWLNGEEMVDITDARIGAAQGRIALQIHDGGGIKVLWRNFRLTTL